MNKDYIFDFVDKTLTDKRKIHTEGVRKMALKLCDIYGADKDEDILNAVSFHTTGRAAMSQIEKIIFISDAIELNRKPYPNLDKIRELAVTDLDKACEMSLKSTINFLKESNKTIDKDTLDAYRYFQER